jgi:proteasome lid subunit RPN8/RPN11
MMRGQSRVVLAEEALQSMVAAASRAAPVETGGVLIGVDLPDGVWITRALEVRLVAGTRTAFRIPAGATHQVVDLIRQADPRLGYIGDWHSHPADLPASPRDLRSLAAIAVGVFRSTRLMGVLRASGEAWQFDLHRMGRLTHGVVDYELGGSLEAEASTS